MTVYELAERTAEAMNEENWCQDIDSKRFYAPDGTVFYRRCAFGWAAKIGGSLGYDLAHSFKDYFGCRI